MPSGPFCTTDISLAAGSGPVSHASANNSPVEWRSDRAKVVATGANAPFAAFTYDVEITPEGKHVGTVNYEPALINAAERLTLANLAKARAQLTVKVSFNDERLGDMVLNLRP